MAAVTITDVAPSSERAAYTSKIQHLKYRRARLRERRGALAERDHLVQFGDAITEAYDSTIATFEDA